MAKDRTQESTTGLDQLPPVQTAKQMDIFERQKLKAALTNRIFRALKEAVDDSMRKQILEEIASLLKLIPVDGTK